jgi:hypothetical protein
MCFFLKKKPPIITKSNVNVGACAETNTSIDPRCVSGRVLHFARTHLRGTTICADGGPFARLRSRTHRNPRLVCRTTIFKRTHMTFAPETTVGKRANVTGQLSDDKGNGEKTNQVTVSSSSPNACSRCFWHSACARFVLVHDLCTFCAVCDPGSEQGRGSSNVGTSQIL